jgi:tRNA(fMet)-specific endonuclease VapC
MKRYLLDTNAMNDWMYRIDGVHEKVRQARSSGAVIGTCELVVAELCYGIAASASTNDNLSYLQRKLTEIKCWPLDRRATEMYGQLMSNSRKRGLGIGIMDGLIAAIALTLPDCAIVSKDTDMVRIPGLAVENWAVVSAS